MNFTDSYYSIVFISDNSKKEEFFKIESEAIRFRRDKAINRFEELFNEVKNNNLKNYLIEFILWEHNIDRDFDNGRIEEFDRFQRNVLFSIKNDIVNVNFQNWQNEAVKGDKYGALFFGKLVKIKGKEGYETSVYNDRLCKLL